MDGMERKWNEAYLQLRLASDISLYKKVSRFLFLLMHADLLYMSFSFLGLLSYVSLSSKNVFRADTFE